MAALAAQQGCTGHAASCPTQAALVDGACLPLCSVDADCLSSEQCGGAPRVCRLRQPSDSGGGPGATFSVWPRTAQNGDPVHLTWNIGGAAAGTVRIQDTTTQHTVLESGPAEGMLDDTPLFFPVTYVLDAAPSVHLSATVGLASENAPLSISRFTSSVSTIRSGDTSLLEWFTTGASSFSIFENGTPIASSSSPAEATHGLLLVAPTSPSEYILEVSNGSETRRSRLTLDVVREPTVTFDVQPITYSSGGPRPELRWTIASGTATELWVNGGMLSNLPLPPYSLSSSGNVCAVLLAEGDDGTKYTIHRHAWFIRDGASVTGEPSLNHTALRYSAHRNMLRLPISGFQGGVMRAFAGGDDGKCSPTFPRLSLTMSHRVSGAPVQLTQRLNPNGCTEFNASGLADADYLIAVDDSAASAGFSYVIYADAHDSPCGDGAIEVDADGLRREECDDGNLLDGDGCSARCTLEPGSQYMGEWLTSGGLPAADGLAPVELEAKDGADPRDEGSATLALPFSARFPFYGSRYAGVIVHADGFLTFRPSKGEVQPLPTEDAAPSAALALFLADLRLSSFPGANGEVLAGLRPSGDFEIQVRNLTGKNETASDHVLLSASVLLKAAGTIEVRYETHRVGQPTPFRVWAGVKDATGQKTADICGEAQCDSAGKLPKSTRYKPGPSTL